MYVLSDQINVMYNAIPGKVYKVSSPFVLMSNVKKCMVMTNNQM